MIVRSSIGGNQVVSLIECSGGAAVSLGAAHIALSGKDSEIVAGSTVR